MKQQLKKLQTLAYILWGLLISSGSVAQALEHPHITKSDSIIGIAVMNGENHVWDFSSLNFGVYKNTSDSDLVHIINPALVYSNSDLNSLNDSLIGNVQEKCFEEKGIKMYRRGNYNMKMEGLGILKTNGMFYAKVKKVKLIESYFYIINNDTIVRYTNTYYLFFNGENKELLLSVFHKTKNLKKIFGSEFTGIEYNKAVAFMNHPGENPLQLVLSPNPASAQTELSYTLINNANVTIELMNQNNTISKIIYKGDRSAGINHTGITLSTYPAGFYIIKVTVDGHAYTTTLIVN